MNTTRRLRHGPGRAHPRRWLLAAVTTPLALAGTAVIPSAGATATQPAANSAVQAPSTTASTSAATAGQGQQLMSLPGLGARSYTVTLITGDKVRLTQASSGQYTATAIPGSGSATQVGFQALGNGQHLTSLQATPDEAAALIGSGQADPGLFDLPWLIKHGDTGAAAAIPVTLQYPPGQSTTTLRSDVAKLPGATVTAAAPAAGTVTMTVAAGKAASFWATLTGHHATGAHAPLSAATATLAGAATRIWLTGHQVSAASPKTQAAQPTYPVTETFSFTSSIGLPDGDCNGYYSYQGSPVAMSARFCLNSADAGVLFGVAGPGQGQKVKGSLACVSLQSAAAAGTRYPLCTQWQETYEVPAGIYYAQADGNFATADNPDHELEEANVEMDVPQLTVAGPAAFTMNPGQAVPVTAATPQPAIHDGPTSMGVIRVAEDGSRYSLFLENLISRGMGNWWAIPTPAAARATVGSYTFTPELSESAPDITAVVDGPQHLNLHPMYQCDDSNPQGYSNCPGEMFSGSHTLQVVDAGQGTPADFANIDAAGKLVLLHQGGCPAGTGGYKWPGGCSSYGLESGQIADARQAGAVGILFVANDNADSPGIYWPLPFNVTLGLVGPYVPFALIDYAQGAALDGLLAKGPVTVTLTEHGPSPYAYFLSPYQEGGIAASQNYTFKARQLAEITSSFHTAAPLPGGPLPPGGQQLWNYAFRSGQYFTSGNAVNLVGSQSLHEYYGPLSPDTAWRLNPTTGVGGFITYQVFGQPSTSTLDWNEPPVTAGAPTPRTAALQAQPGLNLTFCAGCRQGNTFYPFFYLVNGANPATFAEGFGGFTSGAAHLYDSTGKELPPSTYGSSVYYQNLPPGQDRYRLVIAPFQVTGFGYGSTATESATWDFTSAAPSADETPYGTTCFGTALGTSSAPCTAPPLVFLNYDAGLSAANTITPGTRQLQVTGYHQDPAAPPVTSLQLWTSTDGGTTWTPAQVTGGKDGTFTATYTIPAGATSVSIKAQARDAAGNDITQEIDNAYTVAAAAASASSSGR